VYSLVTRTEIELCIIRWLFTDSVYSALKFHCADLDFNDDGYFYTVDNTAIHKFDRILAWHQYTRSRQL